MKSYLFELEKVLTSGWYSMGPETVRAEETLCDLFGVEHCILTNSCTSALYLSLKSVIEPGDQVITSPFTFASAVSAVHCAGGIPVFVDVSTKTGNIDAHALRADVLRSSRVIITSHYGGIPSDPKVAQLARNYGLIVVDDSAHAFGATRSNGTPVQKEADVSCLSFNSTKMVSCGEGGAILTDNSELADQARILRNYGMTKTSYEKSKEGPSFNVRFPSMNFKFNDILSSVLLPQLERKHVNSVLSKRRFIAARYSELSDSPHFGCLEPIEGDRASWLWKPIVLSVSIKNRRTAIIEQMRASGIEVGFHYPLVTDLSMMGTVQSVETEHSTASDLSERILTLPCHEGLVSEDAEWIMAELKDCIRDLTDVH